MTQLTISTWNINQRSGIGEQIPDMVVTELKQLDTDIICLTEYVKTEKHNLFCTRLQNIGYEIFVWTEPEEKPEEPYGAEFKGG